MQKLSFNLICTSNSPHINQVITGFSLLSAQGKIKLKYSLPPKTYGAYQYIASSAVLAEINNELKIYFDMHDSGKIDLNALSKVDIYLKRSFNSIEVKNSDFQNHVFPFGLNFNVMDNNLNLFNIRRTLLEEGNWNKFKSLIKILSPQFSPFLPKLYQLNPINCHLYPNTKLSPRILFITRVFNPESSRSENKEDIISLNQMRTECIRRLRTRFGKYFTGGLIPDKFSTDNYPDLVLTDPGIGYFGNYINLLKEFPICITTTGLHKSIGWKFAEYISFSRAIVSEKLNYYVPGLIVDQNYIEFETPENCIEASQRLMDDSELRSRMMQNNFSFYEKWLRPDVIVWNAISPYLN